MMHTLVVRKWHCCRLRKHVLYSVPKPAIRQISAACHPMLSGDMSKRGYWEDKYKTSCGSGFDWFLKSEALLEIIRQTVTETRRRSSPVHILDLGCGTSDLAWNIFSDPRNTPLVMHCLDFAQPAIEFQRKLFACSENSGSLSDFNQKVTFVVADALQLPYPQNFFDIVIDKGTADSVLRSHSDDRVTKCHSLISKIIACVKPGGVIIQITDEDPDSRVVLIEDAVSHLKTPHNNVSITHTTLKADDLFEYFMYFIRKINCD